MSKKSTSVGLDVTSASHYWQQKERLARFTALGVAVLIAAFALTVYLSDNVNDNVSAAAYLVSTAAGVMLIVWPHLQHTKRHKHHQVPIAETTRSVAQRQLDAYRTQRLLGNCFGIGMGVLAIAGAAVAGNYPDNTGVVIFFLFVAIGVFFLIYVNVIAASYKRLTRKKTRLA
ncbi:hypothetical protein [Lacticaseibacillus jixiensis]|uniref:hypothetical protein n=1 Tax=Lacticaseibacillus jixiensis TaxID=3231926 RepID=UPI0036F23CB5